MFVSVPWSPDMFWSSNCKQHFETVLSHLWQGTQGYLYILFGICLLETGVLYRHWFILIINSYNSSVFNVKLLYGQLLLIFNYTTNKINVWYGFFAVGSAAEGIEATGVVWYTYVVWWKCEWRWMSVQLTCYRTLIYIYFFYRRFIFFCKKILLFV